MNRTCNNRGNTIGHLIEQATHILEGKIRKTPVEYSPELSKLLGQPVYLKLECLQVTGSFKVRGGWFFLVVRETGGQIVFPACVEVFSKRAQGLACRRLAPLSKGNRHELSVTVYVDMYDRILMRAIGGFTSDKTRNVSIM